MDINHIKLQYSRLSRHYEAAKSTKDPISLLDLTHVLRIWVDMKREVNEMCKEQKIQLNFSNPSDSATLKKILKGSPFTYVPLASGMDGLSVRVKGFTYIGRALSAEEVKKMYEDGPPSTTSSNLTFINWLGSTVIRHSPNGSQRQDISREMLIKRVANFLGASHPEGMENSNEYENGFDASIRQLHEIEVANGFRLTYYQLIEIAKAIVENFASTF